jgi:hypothetical protein
MPFLRQRQQQFKFFDQGTPRSDHIIFAEVRRDDPVCGLRYPPSGQSIWCEAALPQPSQQDE